MWKYSPGVQGPTYCDEEIYCKGLQNVTVNKIKLERSKEQTVGTSWYFSRDNMAAVV